MKKLLVLTFAIGFLSVSYAQETRLNAYSMYVFDDDFDSFDSSTSYFEGTIKGGYMWGVGIEHAPTSAVGIELLYLRQDTEVPVNYYRLIDNSKVLDASVNYIMLGGLRYFGQPGSKAVGYTGLMLGTVIYDNKNPEVGEPSSATKFAWGFRLGADIWVTEKVGLKIQGQMVSAVQAMGGSFYVSNAGSGSSVNGYSTIYQFGIGGGLTFRIGE